MNQTALSLTLIGCITHLPRSTFTFVSLNDISGDPTRDFANARPCSAVSKPDKAHFSVIVTALGLFRLRSQDEGKALC